MSHDTARSTKLSHLLRHDKTHSFEYGGWRTLEDLFNEENFTPEELAELVLNDEKGRFEFNESKTKVRALYGHSVPVDMGYEAMTPPAILYHGTSEKAFKSIVEKGLNSRSRNFVHLTCNEDEAFKTGERHGYPIVLIIDAESMVRDGYLFYNPINDMWLVKDVPSKYIIKYKEGFCAEYEVELRGGGITVFCDSKHTVEVLRNDESIVSQCIVANMSRAIFTEDEMSKHFNIFVFTDEVVDENIIEQLKLFMEQTNEILAVSPKPIEGLPYIIASNDEEIIHSLNYLSLLIHSNYLHVDFNDVKTCLLNNPGEIKVLSNAVTLSEDANPWENIKAPVIKDSVNHKHAMIFISIPERTKSEIYTLWIKFIEGMDEICDKGDIDTCFGCSIHKLSDKKVYLAVFLH